MCIHNLDTVKHRQGTFINELVSDKDCFPYTCHTVVDAYLHT